MADGTRRPIERVRVGDLVWSSDPHTARGAPRRAAAVIGGTGVKRLVDLTVDPDGQVGRRTATVTATADHPVWTGSAYGWIDAGDLVFGDRLSTADGHPAMVVAAREHTGVRRVHNLTVCGVDMAGLRPHEIDALNRMKQLLPEEDLRPVSTLRTSPTW